MKKGLILFSILLSIPHYLCAQEDYELIWDNTIQLDHNVSGINTPEIITDDIGNVYLFGYKGSVESDIICIKYDETGDIIWELEYDSGYLRREFQRNILFDSEGNLVVGINTYPPYNFPYSREINIIKITPSGDLILNKNYTFNDNPFHFAYLRLDNEDNMYLYGRTKEDLDVTTSSKSFVTKFNTEGDVLWEQIFPPDIILFVNNVSNSSTVIIGEKNSPSKYYRYKLNSDGQITDSLSWLKNGLDLNGIFNPLGMPYGISTDSYGLINFDELGEVNWVYEKPVAYSENFPPHDKIHYVFQDEAFNTYCIGNYSSVADTTGILISKIDAQGELLWENQQNGLGGRVSIATDVKLEAGVIIITGYSENSSGNYDYLVLKYSSSGELLTTITFDSFSEEAADIPYSIDFLPGDGIVVTGVVQTLPFPGYPKYVTQKYDLVTGIQHQKELLNDASCFPNPFGNDFSISISLDQRIDGVVNIYDSQGSLILSKLATLNEGDNQIFFSGSGLPEGMLVVELKIDDQIVVSKKVIKSR